MNQLQPNQFVVEKGYQMIDAKVLTTDREILLRANPPKRFSHQISQMRKPIRTSGMCNQVKIFTKFDDHFFKKIFFQFF